MKVNIKSGVLAENTIRLDNAPIALPNINNVALETIQIINQF
ncbi:hypothetical protein [uncultured Croceitalea sp.]